MTENSRHDDLLERHFEAARALPPEISDDFLAQVEAQALAEQPPGRSTPPVGAQLLSALGGWPAAAGLAAASAAGLWLGLTGATGLETLWGGDLVQFQLDPLSAFDIAALEG